jgi:UDP-2-acetamido-3-amino-2,3-dideoxy-glucuronate N-acetyltransferase
VLHVGEGWSAGVLAARLLNMEDQTAKAHPTAIVDPGAVVGGRTRIWHWAHVSGGARIGSDCSLGQGVFVGNDVRIGNGVKVQNNVSIYDAVTLEDDVFCGPSMVFTNVINPRAHVPRKHEYRRTIVRKGATIGANATVVCGVEIGAYAFVGAGAVVTGDVQPHSLVLGVPAQRVGWVCACGVRLPDGADAVCPECGAKYAITGDNCEPA